MIQQMRRALVCSTEILSLSTRNFDSSFTISLLKFLSTSTEKCATAGAISDLLLHKHNFSPESAAQVVSAVTRLKNSERYASILSLFKESGFSNSQMEKILKHRPALLSANSERVIRPKIKAFHDFGLSVDDTTDIITADPDILLRSLNNRLIPSLFALKKLLGSSLLVSRLLKISGWFLKYDVENTTVPNVEFLKTCGIAMDQIIWLMYNFPRALLCKPENLSKCVDMIDEMGMSRSSKMFLHAIRVVVSMTRETWEQKLEAFRSIGFSEDDILAAFRKAPQVFSVSPEKMRRLKEVLVESGKYDGQSIIDNPTALICSVERTYKPRLRVLVVLDGKKLIEEWPRFTSLYKMNDERFYRKYVAPYFDEVGELFVKRG